MEGFSPTYPGFPITAAMVISGVFLPARLGVGSSITTKFLRGDGSWQTVVSGVEGFTGSLLTTSPNATINASRLIASGGSTNQDAVFSPKGTGAFLTNSPDNTSTGGNKRGQYAVDLQLFRADKTYIASGDYSVIGGGEHNQNDASDATIAGGNNNYAALGATGAAIAGGGGNSVNGEFGFTAGYSNSAIGDYSVALGYHTRTGTQTFAYSGTTAGQLTDTTAMSNMFFMHDVTLAVGNIDNSARGIQLYSPNISNSYTGAFYTSFKAGVQAANITYTLPTTDGSNGMALTTNGSGVLSWGAAGAGGDALASNPLSQFASTTSLQLLGVMSDETGTGSLVFATSPTLITPALGTPSSGVMTNVTGTAINLTAGKSTNIAGGLGGQILYQSTVDTTLFLANGTNGQVLTSSGGTSSPSWTTPVSGITGFTSALATSSPNATTNISSLAATGGTTNQFLALIPKGASGGIITAIPDSTSSGGNIRGNASVDLQLVRGSASHVASGANSFIVGTNNVGSGIASVAMGTSNAATNTGDFTAGSANTSSGSYCATLGYGNTASAISSVVFGTSNSSAGDYSVALGRNLTLTSAADKTFGFLAYGANAMSIASPNTFAIANCDLWLANNDNTARELRLYEPYNASGVFPSTANYTAFKAGVQSADITYTLPTADGSSGTFLSTNGSGTLTWGTARVTGFTSSLNTSSPNDTANASMIIASGGSTNQDAIVSPKGIGAFQLNLADGTATGGNKRGAYAVDLQLSRDYLNRVASGSYSFAAGSANIVSGTRAVAIGSGGQSSGTDSVVLGNNCQATATESFALGTGSIASATNAIALGYSSYAGTEKSIAIGVMASTKFDASVTIATLHTVWVSAYTTNATPTTMSNYLSALTVPLPEGQFGFEVYVIGRRNDETECAVFKLAGAIRNYYGAVTLIGTIDTIFTKSDAGSAGWAVAITADDTLNTLKIEVTGETGKTVLWWGSVVFF